MGSASARRPLGLPKLTQVFYRIFTLLFSLRNTEVMSLAEVTTPFLRVMQAQKKEKENEVFMTERCEDLEGLDEEREEAQKRSRRYRQRMTEAYGRITREGCL